MKLVVLTKYTIVDYGFGIVGDEPYIETKEETSVFNLTNNDLTSVEKILDKKIKKDRDIVNYCVMFDFPTEKQINFLITHCGYPIYKAMTTSKKDATTIIGKRIEEMKRDQYHYLDGPDIEDFAYASFFYNIYKGGGD